MRTDDVEHVETFVSAPAMTDLHALVRKICISCGCSGHIRNWFQMLLLAIFRTTLGHLESLRINFINLRQPFVHCINKNSIRGAAAAPAQSCLTASRRIRSVKKKVTLNVSSQVCAIYFGISFSFPRLFRLSSCLVLNWH